MSTPEALLFDALTGAAGPATALGERVTDPVVQARFEAVVAKAEASVRSFFSIPLPPGPERAQALDQVVSDLWAAKWDPHSANADLFALHFGALVMDAALRLGASEPVFRSDRDLTHASLWYPAHRVELFPFHKAFKAVTRGPSESLREFMEIARQLSAATAS